MSSIVVGVVGGLVLGLLLGRMRTLPVVARVLVGLAAAVALVGYWYGLNSETSQPWAAAGSAFGAAILVSSLVELRKHAQR